jgi:hypothetical protein
MKDLIEKFCPLYHFDSRETHYTLDFNAYLKNITRINSVNVYVREIDQETLWIYYICFYLYDPGTKCCLPFNCYCTDFRFSEHEYDFEMVIIEVKNKESISRVCFCPHGLEENYWISGRMENSSDNKSKNDDKTENDDLYRILDRRDRCRIHVYVSRHKHASYPLPGIIWRYMGFANDYNNNDHEENPHRLKPYVLTNESIESDIFKSKKKCLSFDYNTVPTLTLGQVKYHMFFG